MEVFASCRMSKREAVGGEVLRSLERRRLWEILEVSVPEFQVLVLSLK